LSTYKKDELISIITFDLLWLITNDIITLIDKINSTILKEIELIEDPCNIELYEIIHEYPDKEI